MINRRRLPETGAKGERNMMQQARSNSYLFGGNAPYVEEMYEASSTTRLGQRELARVFRRALQNVPATDGSGARRGARAGRQIPVAR